MGRIIKPQVVIPFARRTGARGPIVRHAQSAIDATVWFEGWKSSQGWHSQSNGHLAAFPGGASDPTPLVGMSGYSFVAASAQDFAISDTNKITGDSPWTMWILVKPTSTSAKTVFFRGNGSVPLAGRSFLLNFPAVGSLGVEFGGNNGQRAAGVVTNNAIQFFSASKTPGVIGNTNIYKKRSTCNCHT
jgi:hypothetical protein